MKVLIGLFLIVFAFVGKTHATQYPQARVVVVSDIDDTLKVSHVLDYLAAAADAVRVDNVFRGMPLLFQLIHQTSPKIPFFYLSNAPAPLATAFHQKFLDQNKFPPGTLLLRNKYPIELHKIMNLREIINQTKAQYLIAFGDNGERDVYVYEEIHREFPSLQIVTYIHQVYYTAAEKHPGQDLFDDQVGFVSSVEVGMDLAFKRLLSLPQVQMLMDAVIPPMLRTMAYEDSEGRFGELSFPHWQDCRDFVWPDQLDVNWGRDMLMNAFKSRLNQRCNVAPNDK
jgi:hypothetical protein